MSLTPEQKQFYENSLSMARADLEEIDRSIEEELAKVRDRIADLQEAKKAARQMYDAACLRLGVPNELAAEEGEEDDESGF
ncbi:MAG: hypothetical protein AAGD01_00715 [Acidobacteriota bacterium]